MGDVIDKKDGSYICMHVTGPSHNYLRLEFGKKLFARPKLIEIQGTRNCGCKPVNPAKIKEMVLEGLCGINKELGQSYRLKKIYYFNDDSSPEYVYGYLTRKIVRFMHENKKA